MRKFGAFAAAIMAVPASAGTRRDHKREVELSEDSLGRMAEFRKREPQVHVSSTVATETASGATVPRQRVGATDGMSDVFRFLERSFFKQPSRGKVRPAPEEQVFQRHASETIETHPYALVVGNKVCGLFQRGDDVVKRAQHMGPKAEVWHVGWKHRRVEGAECQVVRSDRAKGPSAHLHGSSLRTVHQYVPTTLSRQVVWTARDGFTAAA
jgi:hypothetical protein